VWGGRPRPRRTPWSGSSHVRPGRPGGRPRARGPAPQNRRGVRRNEDVVVQINTDLCSVISATLTGTLEGTLENNQEQHGLVRGLGLLQATALNMSNMVGIGPFITIPLIIASMGGPQRMLGWVLGAIVALCDGLVWSELAAAMPGPAGTYRYLSEAFRNTRLGGILPFLF